MTFRRFAAALAAGALLVQPVHAFAEDAKATSGPSAFVRCDGSPNKPSTLGTVARLVAITAVVGLLLPQREAADPKKRESGEAGIKACDEALGGAEQAKDGGRRIELIFGRAIHRMETKDWDGAIADIHSVSADQPELTATDAYKYSLGLTAMNLEAMALVGKQDYAGAEALGLRMAEVAPYDLINQLRASAFVRLGDDYSPGKERYYAQVVKIWPAALYERAAVLSKAGRFVDAAKDLEAAAALSDSMPKGRGYVAQARAAIAYRLAGNAAEGDRLDALARQRADRDLAEGKTDAQIAAQSEAADFYAILSALDAGQAMRARTQFSARSRWNTLPSGFVAELARRLRQTGTPPEQANTPIPSPDEVYQAERARAAAVIDDPGDDNADRFRTFREAFAPNAFTRFSTNVWRTDKSRYIDKTPNEKLDAETVNVMRDGTGVPAGYAMLLHLALVAKARGANGFMMVPGQIYTYLHFARIGNADGKRIVAQAMFDPDKVIADLAPLIPQPVKAK